MKTSSMYLKILLNIIIVMIMLVLVIFVLPRLISFFLPFVIGWFIAMIVSPFARFLEKKLKLAQKHGSAIIISLIILLLVWITYFSISSLVTQTMNLIKDLPNIYVVVEDQITKAANNLMGLYNVLPQEVQYVVLSLSENLTKYFETIISNLATFSFNAASITKNLSYGFILFIITILSSYFFVSEKESIVKAINDNTPISVKEKYTFIMGTLRTAVGGYVKAQFKITGIIFVIMFVGLGILKVNYTFLLSVVIAILDFLPLFGSGTVLIPWALFELFSGNSGRAIGLAIIYLVSLIVRQVIQPKIVGDSVGLSPLSTLIFMYIGLQYKGILGMILAIPIGMIVINLYKAGVFKGLINSMKSVINQINEYRKIQ